MIIDEDFYKSIIDDNEEKVSEQQREMFDELSSAKELDIPAYKRAQIKNKIFDRIEKKKNKAFGFNYYYAASVLTVMIVMLIGLSIYNKPGVIEQGQEINTDQELVAMLNNVDEDTLKILQEDIDFIEDIDIISDDEFMKYIEQTTDEDKNNPV